MHRTKKLSNGSVPTVIARIAATAVSLALSVLAHGQNVTPHAQDRPPGPALSPAEAIAKMEVPPGFKVELVAAEPDLVNPTAMTFDDRGRIWVCESIEYPRSSPGAGKDRVKILEDTDGDGRYEKVTIFKDGLNIPCGVAIGNGGVYITNSPDVLFCRDTNGDDVADTTEVLFTGFGRADTHELPNNLTWGPDGWLYGMNGVFNPSKVEDPATGKEYDFTCAIWRYHPPTKRFELFAEGTSNPWGLDYNRNGDFFTSACVIDHLWHMTQTGYYIRQGGAYPPDTIPLGSISTELHQKAAYAGLAYYDADAYPQQYRGKLLMGNLHGSAINVDKLERNGSTYTQTNDPDFLQANDAWFMPVSQRLGPDGCLYIMDWYDRYHCYQDARRDSPGLDRLKGRIYRISYNTTPLARGFDLSKSTPDELIKTLGHSNAWWRRTAQRLLNERFDESLRPRIEELALSTDYTTEVPIHALWLLVSQQKLDPAFHLKALNHPRPVTRRWAVHAAAEMRRIDPQVLARLVEMAKTDESPDVRLQLAIAAGRVTHPVTLPLFEALLSNPASAADPLIPNILYQNFKPLARQHGAAILAFLDAHPDAEKAFGDTFARWVREGVAAMGLPPAELVARLQPALANADADPRRTAQALQGVINALSQTSLSTADRANLFSPELRQTISAIATGQTPARFAATAIAMWWDDPAALDAARRIVADRSADPAARTQLLRALADRKDPANLDTFAAFIADDGAPLRLRREAVDALGAAASDKAANLLTSSYPSLSPELKPAVVNSLTRSTASAAALLDAIESKRIPTGDVTANHVRQIHALGDKALVTRVTKLWGAVRTDRDPRRVQVVQRMRESLRNHTGDPTRGWAVFNKTCVQCHTIYGKGGQVGPDITGVGRENLDAILANVIDPNLVIGASYLVNVAKLKDDTVVSGIVTEQSPDRIVLKDGTKTYALNRADIVKIVQQNVSMMPEGLEAGMTEQDFADLVAFLLTREPPPAPPPTTAPAATPSASH